MTKTFFHRIIYSCYYISYLMSEKKIHDQKKRNNIAVSFVKYNNRLVLKNINKQEIKNISILLPHCIQSYDCKYKITSDIENCVRCKKCKIYRFLEFKEKYNVDVKIATGGTLARLYLREKHPDFIIAVACKRDLISGIYDAFSQNIYGIFNKIVESPCINTDIDLDEVEEILKKLYYKE